MVKLLQEKWKTKDIEFGIFLLFLLGMAVYYGWRLFALTPWYDELYTYYYFVSRGPIYSAIHWPLPNNHVGYSVLSGFLNLFGNSAIGLRGVSWICSLISLCLLFAIGKKCFPKGFAMVPVFLFSAMDLVNQLAVQGRGYALTTCLYLTAFYELTQIIMAGKNQKRHYIIFGCSLIWALYTLASSVYFVIPICVIGGMVLLMQKRGREFITLFITAVISAVCTVGLYTIIWLAIGSNLLSKTADSGWYGQGHVSIILHAPFQAIGAGIDYMLGMPYIQSVPREGYFSRFGSWIKALLEYYYPGLSVLLIVVIIIALAGVVWKMVFKKKIREQGLLEWFLLVSFVITPVMLMVQAALPYYRVFSYFGIPVALLITWLFVQLVRMSKKMQLSYGVTLCTGVFCILVLILPSSRVQYSDREAAIEDVILHMDMKEGMRVCVTDCDQEYLMKYLCDIETVQYTPVEAEYAMFDKLLLSEETFQQANAADFWKFYITPEEIVWDDIEKTMDVCYENDRFILYQKRNE